MNNKIIAEFSGYFEKLNSGEFAVKNIKDNPYKDLDYDSFYNGFPSYLKFHKSMDWLIPVLEKIQNNKEIVYIDSTNIRIGDYINSFPFDTKWDKKIEYLNELIVKYIKNKKWN
jgi:hypothetical protein